MQNADSVRSYFSGPAQEAEYNKARISELYASTAQKVLKAATIDDQRGLKSIKDIPKALEALEKQTAASLEAAYGKDYAQMNLIPKMKEMNEQLEDAAKTGVHNYWGEVFRGYEGQFEAALKSGNMAAARQIADEWRPRLAKQLTAGDLTGAQKDAFSGYFLMPKEKVAAAGGSFRAAGVINADAYLDYLVNQSKDKSMMINGVAVKSDGTKGATIPQVINMMEADAKSNGSLPNNASREQLATFRHDATVDIINGLTKRMNDKGFAASDEGRKFLALINAPTMTKDEFKKRSKARGITYTDENIAAAYKEHLADVNTIVLKELLSIDNGFGDMNAAERNASIKRIKQFYMDSDLDWMTDQQNNGQTLNQAYDVVKSFDNLTSVNEYGKRVPITPEAGATQERAVATLAPHFEKALSAGKIKIDGKTIGADSKVTQYGGSLIITGQKWGGEEEGIVDKRYIATPVKDEGTEIWELRPITAEGRPAGYATYLTKDFKPYKTKEAVRKQKRRDYLDERRPNESDFEFYTRKGLLN